MNLLFDLDGTLADPFKAIKGSLMHAFDKQSLPPPTDEQMRKCIGPPIQDSLIRILNLSQETADQVLKDFREHHSEHCFTDYEFYSGAFDTLARLKTKTRLFVATSKPHPFARPILERHGFAHFFEGIYGSELNGVRSSKTDLIKYLLESEDLKSEDSLMIGDREHDGIGAKNNHLNFLGVTWGYGSENELENAGSIAVANTWKELEDFILKRLF